MQNHSEYTIKTAAYPFRCFVCDCIVERGSTYCEVDRERLCVTCGLPARRLRPLNQKELTNQKSING